MCNGFIVVVAVAVVAVATMNYTKNILKNQIIKKKRLNRDEKLTKLCVVS